MAGDHGPDRARSRELAFRYFFGYGLPKIEGLIKRLTNSDGLTVEMEESFFQD
jgi:hypothetical protein